ncbi:hypothetical protein [Hymenobacter nivis]|uniref:Glycosyltransferase RgtA/B/C/D-like domain-containing protein n=1 Tax=Hymenobacter nivis TaxID=1850093 RepID=A0A2Z3GR13_9BACT|nr:hypothetical protein [Hymenobacter nivis]AWM33485.1 hypothetical protein DDQ68_12225 [Hymenobacter nivis]
MAPLRTTLDDFADSDRVARGLLVIGLLVSVAFVFITKNPYDTGDSIQHYLYARYAPQHPLNLLHSWAKPFFTLVIMGPSQLGYRVLMLFQCGLVAASAWLSYRVARALRVPYAALAILCCYAAPDYFRIQFSGLTEPLFGLVLVGGVALAVAGRPAWSVALVSWLPFVRSEGFILLGLWVLYLGWQRQWRALPLVFLGYAMYSAVGALVLHEPGWVFGRNAYSTLSAYGHGGWGQFAVGLVSLLGWVIGALAVLGGGQLLWRAARRTNWQNPFFRAELLLVYGSAAVFVAAHTLFWVFGLFGSAGLVRVLASLMPLLAIIALRGLSVLCALGRTAAARQRIALGVAALAVVFLFTGLRMEMRWQRDFAIPGDLALAEQAAAWYRQQPGTPARPVVLDHPAIGRALDVDVFDRRARPIASVNGHTSLEQLPVGTLVFWDDWFSTVEGNLPLEMLVTNPHFRQRWAGAQLRQADNPSRGTARLVVFEKVR